MKSWLRIMRVGLCAAAVVETLLSTASVATTAHKKALAADLIPAAALCPPGVASGCIAGCR